MAENLVVVERAHDWKPHFPDVRIVTARSYLEGPHDSPDTRVLNLCRSYRYLSEGYYVSLLAEARRHRVVPTVRTINEIAQKAVYRLDFDDLEEVVKKTFRNGSPRDSVSLDVFFGRCDEPALESLGRALAEVYRVPLLRAELRNQEGWRLASLRPLSIHQLDADQEVAFLKGLDGYLGNRWRRGRSRTRRRYDLAILHDPAEKLPPSDPKALDAFVRAGKREGLNVDLITRRDYNRLAEYDALFIRETTGINHHTFRFAKKAEAEGLVVIDDPDSILECTNKVYLSELLRRNRVSTPRTVILHRDTRDAAAEQLEYPMVLKIPDGSFSRGVFRAEGPDDLRRITEDLFRHSDLILAQEYVYTPFDWRIGVLNGEPIFACQYHMSRQHWQIIRHEAGGKYSEGKWKTFAVEDAPSAVVRSARRAARLIGRGLYGVDVKEVGKRALVIEVNDNPNIDAGVEDGVLKSRLYRMVMAEFVRRIESRK